jgi:hypothetical protein
LHIKLKTLPLHPLKERTKSESDLKSWKREKS